MAENIDLGESSCGGYWVFTCDQVLGGSGGHHGHNDLRKRFWGVIGNMWEYD